MQQFIVPQFIDVENKIIGPISPRQFIIMLAAGGLIFVCYKLLTFAPFIVAAALILGIGALFAFVKINGQQFHYFMLNIIQTLKRPGLRTWKKEIDDKSREAVEAEMKILPTRKLVSSSHLSELSLIVDTGGTYQENVVDKNKNNKKIKK